MNKLLELGNARIDITLSKYDFNSTWKLQLSRDDDGVTLRIFVEGDVLEDVVAEGYEKWVKATGKGLPNHTLAQIEHYPAPPAPRSLDNEIPF